MITEFYPTFGKEPVRPCLPVHAIIPAPGRWRQEGFENNVDSVDETLSPLTPPCEEQEAEAWCRRDSRASSGGIRLLENMSCFGVLFISCRSGWPRMGSVAKDNLDS